MRKKDYFSLLFGILFCMFVLTACSITINLDDTGASRDETKKAMAAEVTQEDEYFVDGNLLCTRWMENGAENREWWEISIDGNKMNWSALREDEDGKTFTATFEMTKVQ